MLRVLEFPLRRAAKPVAVLEVAVRVTELTRLARPAQPGRGAPVAAELVHRPVETAQLMAVPVVWVVLATSLGVVAEVAEPVTVVAQEVPQVPVAVP
jgi:hypothetical protein